jgi:O-acetylhomoserine (thiol)-lyase
MENNFGFETLQIRGGYDYNEMSGSVATPISQTTAYVFNDYEYAKDLFALKQAGHIYTRITNPTVEMLEKRMAKLDGAAASLAVSSGHSAIFMAVFSLAKAGDEIVSSKYIYGGAINMFTTTLKRMGITVHLIDSDNILEFDKYTNEKTKAYFIESIGNPNANVSDIKGISKIARKNGVPLIVDATFATPYLQKPISLGADIVIHSATKFLTGNGTAMCGIISDAGTFDYTNGRFSEFTEPDESYHGIRYAFDALTCPLATKARVTLLRDIGCCLSPFNAFLVMQGIETLSLRMEKICQNALTVAEFLEAHSNVTKVNYPGLKSNKYNILANEILPNGCGGVFTFEIKGDREAGKRFIEKLKLFLHVANVGDARSLVVHPATTTHSQLSREALIASGITENTVRLSIGLENIEDIINDLKQALA